jgi:PQQ-dependent dehydrogenase (s-GDH family)
MRCVYLLLASFLSCSPAEKTNESGKTSNGDITTRVIADDLTHVWEIIWGPDNFLWITERDGRISRIDPANGSKKVLLTVPDVESRGEGGLLGMVLDPSFSRNGYLYIAYNYNAAAGYREKLVRYTYNNNGTLADPFILVDGIEAAGIHNGSRLVIHDGKLFMSTGDASNQSLPQNRSSLNGKILRMNLDGSVPADNPIPGSPVWSWGHRNAQGLVFVGNTLFSSEHGATTDDEINIIEKGRNYGWPEVEGFCDEADERSFCNGNNIKEPLKAWTPTVAFAGMDYYNADNIPEWKNCLLVTTLKNRRLYVMKLNEARDQIENVSEYFKDYFGRLRDVCVAPDGKVYIGTTNGGGDQIIEISGK